MNFCVKMSRYPILKVDIRFQKTHEPTLSYVSQDKFSKAQLREAIYSNPHGKDDGLWSSFIYLSFFLEKEKKNINAKKITTRMDSKIASLPYIFIWHCSLLYTFCCLLANKIMKILARKQKKKYIYIFAYCKITKISKEARKCIQKSNNWH